MLDMLDVFITGAGGWIGGQVLSRLKVPRADGTRLRVVGIPYCAGMSASLLEKHAQRARVVVHCGGVYSEERGKFIEQNIEQGVAIATGVEKAKNTVIFCSSVKTYGWAWSDSHVCTEADGSPALDAFGRGKKLIEELFSITAMRSYALRIGNVYGSGGPSRYVIGKMLKDAKETGQITITCDGSSLRDFVHLDDVAEVIVRAVYRSLEEPQSPTHEVFNVVSGARISLGAVGEILSGISGCRVVYGGGRVLHGPAMSPQKVLDAGLIGSFIRPEGGLADLFRREFRV